MNIIKSLLTTLKRNPAVLGATVTTVVGLLASWGLNVPVTTLATINGVVAMLVGLLVRTAVTPVVGIRYAAILRRGAESVTDSSTCPSGRCRSVCR